MKTKPNDRYTISLEDGKFPILQVMHGQPLLYPLDPFLTKHEWVMSSITTSKMRLFVLDLNRL